VITAPRSGRQLGIEDADWNSELFQVELHFVAAIDVVDEDDRLSADQLQLKQRVHQHELVLLFKSVEKC